MPIIQVLCSNPLVNICAVAWFAAQVIKTLLHWVSHGNLKLERMTGSGGMPSSHSALVVSLTIGMARVVGFASPLFALAVAFVAVVMYDAMGVRRAAGEQARILNRMVDIWEERGASVSEKELKEHLGHTPMEVLAGAMLGIVVAVALI